MSLTCFGHLGSLFSLAYPSIDVTGALVPHLPKCMVFGLGFSVLVCLSVDVTGALVLLIRFFGSAPSCFVLAPPPYFLFQFALHLHFGSAHYDLHKFGLCCPLSLWWFCGSLVCCPAGLVGSLCVWLLFVRLLVFLAPLRSSLCVSWPCWSCGFCPLLFLAPFSVRFVFPSPARCLVWCPGPARYLVCWYLPLGIWLQL